MAVLPMCVSVYHVYAWCQKPKAIYRPLPHRCFQKHQAKGLVSYSCPSGDRPDPSWSCSTPLITRSDRGPQYWGILHLKMPLTLN